MNKVTIFQELHNLYADNELNLSAACDAYTDRGLQASFLVCTHELIISTDSKEFETQRHAAHCTHGVL